MNIFPFIIIVLCIVTIILACLAKYIPENFEDLDYSCEATQNKYYHPRELLYKASCPNLVIVEKNSFGVPLFTAEVGDQNGPYFSKDYIRYYHLGVSPDGVVLDLEYDLYYRPWYNPIRWFGGPYGYYRPRRWNRQRKWNKWNRDGYRRDGYRRDGYRRNFWDRQDRQDRQDQRIKNLENKINKSPVRNINKRVPVKGPVKGPVKVPMKDQVKRPAKGPLKGQGRSAALW